MDMIARFSTTIVNSTTGLPPCTSTLFAEDAVTSTLEKIRGDQENLLFIPIILSCTIINSHSDPSMDLVGIDVFCPALIPGNKYEETPCNKVRCNVTFCFCHENIFQ